MPINKPRGMALRLSTSDHAHSSDDNAMSDTGSLAVGGFNIGRHGITQSPLSVGEISSLRLDQLHLGHKLGRGNSSRVYLASHLPTGKPVAIKILQPSSDSSTAESVRLALNEVRTVFQARSDHLVSFYDAFHHEGSLHLVLEYMDAGSLENLFSTMVRANEMIPEAAVGQLLWQMLQGLIYLHREKRAVHRDLKPANVLLNASGFVKLSDFGISRSLDETQALAATYCGTAQYMAPERLSESGVYGYPSDVWSLGLITLEGLVGRYPYARSSNHFDLVNSVVNGPPPTEDADVRRVLSPDLWDLLNTALAKAPHERPDATQMARHSFMQRLHAMPFDLAVFIRRSVDLQQQQSSEPLSLEM